MTTNLTHRLSNTFRGYTLLELIVSIGLFSIVMLIATGAYLALIELDRRARATNELTSNLSFAIDSMARSIRTGTDFGCGSTGGASGGTNGTPCSTSPSQFSFLDSYSNEKITYRLLSDGTIGRCIGTSCTGDASFTPLTDSRIQISTSNPTGLLFYVRGVGTGDQTQPQVLISIHGTMIADDEGNVVPFTMQTGATQRLIEL